MQIIRKIRPHTDPWERIDFEKQGGGMTDTLKGGKSDRCRCYPVHWGSTDTPI